MNRDEVLLNVARRESERLACGQESIRNADILVCELSNSLKARSRAVVADLESLVAASLAACLVGFYSSTIKLPQFLQPGAYYELPAGDKGSMVASTQVILERAGLTVAPASNFVRVLEERRQGVVVALRQRTTAVGSEAAAVAANSEEVTGARSVDPLAAGASGDAQNQAVGGGAVWMRARQPETNLRLASDVLRQQICAAFTNHNVAYEVTTKQLSETATATPHRCM